MEETECNPEACPYAKGHYDRVNDAVFELISAKEAFDRAAILEQAEKWRVCPFEMSLDTALWSDAVICDYNYLFDPRAKLKRFFGDNNKGEYLFLIDEAHNLVDRAREMFSASLYKEDFLSPEKRSEGAKQEADACAGTVQCMAAGEKKRAGRACSTGRYRNISGVSDESVRCDGRISGEQSQCCA